MEKLRNNTIEKKIMQAEKNIKKLEQEIAWLEYLLYEGEKSTIQVFFTDLPDKYKMVDKRRLLRDLRLSKHIKGVVTHGDIYHSPAWVVIKDKWQI